MSNHLGPEWEAYLRLMEERPDAFTATQLQQDEAVLQIITDAERVSDFSQKSGRKIGVLYQSPYNLLVVDLVQAPDGHLFCYERLLPREKGAVVCLTVCKGNYILVEQYRHALQAKQTAFVRGYGEPGLSPEVNAEKELKEELGAQILSISPLGLVYSDSGTCGSPVTVFYCEIESYEEHVGHEGICRTVALTPSEMTQWLTEGKITDGYTLSALALEDHLKKI